MTRPPPAVLSEADFLAARAYLRLTAGLVFDASRRSALASALAERVGVTGKRTVPAYLQYVQSPGGVREREVLLDTVTVQETHFFRNGPQMEALRRQVLPELMRRCALESRPLRIWSAGCSTGEEPYTLGMLALDAAATTPGGARVPITIVGTDISAAAIARASRAVYSGRSLSLVDRPSRQRWFREAPGGGSLVHPDVRRIVDLRVQNLVSGPGAHEATALDLIVCRNVTIYFDRDTTRSLVERFHAGLVDGGYLMLGHSETLWQLSDAFALVPIGDAFAYRKDANAPSTVAARGRRVVPPRLPPARSPAPRLLPLLRRPTPVVVAPARSAPDPRRDLASARQAFAAGHYAEAASLAARAAAADPLQAAGWTLQGQALSTLGQDTDALVALRKAVYLDPAAGDAQFLLAGALSRVGEVGGAGRAYRAAAATLPRVSADVLHGLLDGRDVSDLVELCRRLADAADKMRMGGSS